jgi:hypothetical protein
MEAYLAMSLLALAYLIWIAVWPSLVSHLRSLSQTAGVPVLVQARSPQTTLGGRGGRRSGKTFLR